MAVWILIGLLVLVIAAVPVAAVLGILSFVLDQIAMGGNLQAGIGEIIWDKSKEFILVAVPMFILLGEIMLRAGIARRMYGAVIQWLSWLPAGLMHANIGSCTIFAASSGSNIATTATVGTVAYPEIEARSYNEPFSQFTPSRRNAGHSRAAIDQSYSLWIVDRHVRTRALSRWYYPGADPVAFHECDRHCLSVRKDWGGQKVETSWGERLGSLPHLYRVFAFLCRCRFYLRRLAATEAASIGVVMALIITACFKTLSFSMLRDAFEGDADNRDDHDHRVFGDLLELRPRFCRITQSMFNFIAALRLTPVETILLLVLFYLLIGMFAAYP